VKPGAWVQFRIRSLVDGKAMTHERYGRHDERIVRNPTRHKALFGSTH
jgi:hypothetical protein